MQEKLENDRTVIKLNCTNLQTKKNILGQFYSKTATVLGLDVGHPAMCEQIVQCIVLKDGGTYENLVGTN